MKCKLLIPMLILLVGCDNQISKTTQINENLVLVDLTNTYTSEKELLLQDFMDVEYIPLETNDEFVNYGLVEDVGENLLLVKNSENGDIFLYERTGKALRKINKKGQGEKEYINCFNIVLDEVNEEIFVNDIFTQRILVYDLYGMFKRCFKHKTSSSGFYFDEVLNYDKEYLLCYDLYSKDMPFVLISKRDGEISENINIPFDEKIMLHLRKEENGKFMTASPGSYRNIIHYKDTWLLSELSSDTVYRLLDDLSLCPYLVRVPSIQATNDVFLVIRLMSDRYIFMETIINQYNWDTKKGFPRTFFMYDIKECAFSGYSVYNGDYTIKKEIYMNSLRPLNFQIESCDALPAHQLIESYNKGELKGRLKEIAATLDEDSNPVIMLIKHKQSNE